MRLNLLECLRRVNLYIFLVLTEGSLRAWMSFDIRRGDIPASQGSPSTTVSTALIVSTTGIISALRLRN